MTGNAPATLVWIAPSPPTGAEERSIDAWTAEHHVARAEPAEGTPQRISVDLRVGDRIEELLDRARDAATAHDDETVTRSLDAAEALLRAHPELPQAAWLMAEVLRARGDRLARAATPDPEGANRAWLRAAALDGGRLPSVGEPAAIGRPDAARVRVAVPAHERAALDGAISEGSDGARTVGAGLHAIVVTWGDSPVWAQWVEIPAGDSSLQPPSPGVPPCSQEDLDQVTLAGAATVRAAGVTCARWVALAPGARNGAVRVAACAFDRCEPLAEWDMPRPAVRWTVAPRRRERNWPAWATWTLAGGGLVAVAAGVAVTAALVTARSSSPQSRFIAGGLVGAP